MNLGFLGKGNASLARAARRAGRSRRDRPEAARGLGHDAGRDRQLPQGRRRDRRPGRDPHRHAERIGLRRDTLAAFKGRTIHTYPHRRRRRRPRARHHQGVRRAERAAVVDQPDAAVHRQHDRRAPRHADGLPSPRPGDRRGRRVRRIAHPPRDDRRRGHPARPRRVLDDLVGLAGDGPRRRGDHAHLADRAQDEGAARHARGRPGDARQLPRQALHREVHDQPGDHARHRARGRLGRAGQARRPRAVEAGVLRREAGAGPQGRHDRRRRDGRPERVDPDAAAGALPADVRRVRQALAHVA